LSDIYCNLNKVKSVSILKITCRDLNTINLGLQENWKKYHVTPAASGLQDHIYYIVETTRHIL
jgi:hypothetical protein